MAIHAITGVMGSGKSHEAVKEKVCVALKSDDTRRVVTNIEGLNYAEIAKYVGKPLENIEKRLVHVPYERPSEPHFWYDPASTALTVVQAGDLIVLDEVWRYYNRGTKLPEDAMLFFRMHRHYADADTGQTCDIVLINQALRGIHQDIRDVIEVQYNCRKLKVLGRPSNYQVFVIEGSERKASHNFLRKYDAKVFPLYSSYAQKNATESVDKRQSALSRPFFKIVLPLAFLGIAGGSYSTYKYFDNMRHPAGYTPSHAATSSTTAPAAGAPAAASAPSSPIASSWRLVLTYKVGDILVALVTNERGVYRTIPVSDYKKTTGNDIAVRVSDESAGYASPFTGPAPTYNAPQGARK